MSKPRARSATRWPMRPKPMIPRVFPWSSTPVSLRFHSPAFIEASASGTRRASESRRAKVCSVADIRLAVDALTTRMPSSVAAATSTLSTPMPARLGRQLVDLHPGLLEEREAGGVEGVGDQDLGHAISPSAGGRSGHLLQDLVDDGQQGLEVALPHLAHVADAEGGRLPVAAAA